MAQTSLAPLGAWVNFYVIVGSSAGALTGLQFVVMTLIADVQKPGTMQEVRAFGTPTVVHFCAVLLISAIMSAPWPSLSNLDACLGVCGGLGIAYAIRVVWHARKAAYKPDLEDWIWYAAFPLVAYTALATAGILLWRRPVFCAFAIAATALLLLFIGIHNAWDTVTYVAFTSSKGAERSEPENVR